MGDEDKRPSTDVDTRTNSTLRVTNVNRQTQSDASTPFGIRIVPADPFENSKLGLKGVKDFYVAAASEPRIVEIFKEIRGRGCKVTSSGAQRDLNAGVTAARSGTSLHYPAIALDLYMFSGMVDVTVDEYIVTADPTSDGSIGLWTVFGKSQDPTTPEVSLSAQTFVNVSRPKGVTAKEIRHPCRLNPPAPVTGRFVNITELFLARGFQRISAKEGFTKNPSCRDYEAAEWWHFQDENDLVPGKTTYREVLQRVYTSKQIEKSKLTAELGKVWNGKAFV